MPAEGAGRGRDTDHSAPSAQIRTLGIEALAFADAVVVSEAEDLWPGLLRDFKQHRLGRVYRGALPSLVRRCSW